jgi:thiamine-phosphate pyrophosphorylase
MPSLVERIGAAARAGVHLVQVRQPHLDGRRLLALVEQATAAVEGTDARIVVNDRVDVAFETRAHGVHLRGDSIPAPRVRAAARRRVVIGRSVHRPDEAIHVTRQGGLDYLIFGSVFASRLKPGVKAVGVGSLAAVCRSVVLPVLAVGGITLDRVDAVARKGAAGFAAIGMFADAPLAVLATLVHDASRAFDTPKRLS